MARFVLNRLLWGIPVLCAVVTITFGLIRLAPGGPFTEEKRYPPEALARLNRYYGLDRPLYEQYFRYVRGLLRGDLGPSLHYPDRTVNEIIAETFPVSLELGCYALLFALIFGLSSGILAALRPNSLGDHCVMGLAMLGICVPSFVLGPLLVLIFALGLHWCNATGWETTTDRILPAMTLGSTYAAYIARLTRAGMLEVLPQDYIRTARAKGLTELQVIIRHTLKPALFPVASFLGPATAGLITGSFVIETVFHIPGLGRMFVLAAFNRDYTLAMGLAVFYAAVMVFFNSLVDVVLVWLNPRLTLDT
ncbi:MAG: ABC transporter permease subunit [Kiritimatiellae bacterium]|nr:ABC transporter permease subunit [Kiritimatiellia bacterium]